MADCEHVPGVYRATLLVLVFSLSARALGQPAVTGYLEYQGRQETREGRGHLQSNLATLRVDADAPLWKPWLAQLTMGLGLSYHETREEQLSQTGTEITGGARLRLLPRSIFPFEAFVERFDSRIEGELVGPTYSQTVYGFTQTFRPAVGAQYQLGYRHTDRTDEDRYLIGQESSSQEDQVNVAINRAFRNHQLDFNSDYARIERDIPSQADQRTVNVLRYRYSPGTNLSIDSLVSNVASELEQETVLSRTDQAQLSSNLFWRPGTSKPLLITGSMLASGFDTENNGSQNENRLYSLSGSSNYQTTPELSWRVNASLSENRNAGNERRTSLVRTGLTYSPSEVPLGEWVYRYTLSGDVGSRGDSAFRDTQEVSSSLSHVLNRSGKLSGGTAGISISQQFTGLRDTADRDERSFVNSAIFDWSSGSGRKTLFLRALASDTRRVDGEDTVFQIVNFQANGNVQSTRVSSWAGSATVQWTRTNNSFSSGPWLASGSVNLVYRHERLFRVPLLRFSSELRLLSEDLARAATDEFSRDSRETAAWVNRLDYLIGRSQISLRGQVSRVDGLDYALIYLQLRRYFGRYAQ